MEAVEYAELLRLWQYTIRHDSGGAEKQRGSDGVVREIEVLTEAQSHYFPTVAASLPTA